MKKNIIIATTAGLIIAGLVITLMMPPSLRAKARREWKETRIVEIARRTSVTQEIDKEIARLGSLPPGANHWLSDKVILMSNGEWLAYASICHKEKQGIHDLFLAQGSDGKWYYSTYHFCTGMVVLDKDGRPASITAFIKKYSVRPFDGQSDECLRSTWPDDSSK